MHRARFAAALVVTALLGCGGGGGGGGGGPVAAFVCDGLAGCGMPVGYRSTCLEMARPLDLYVVDPGAVAACLAAADVTCDDLLGLDTSDPGQTPAWLADCLAYDTASFQCSEDQATLQVCNTSAVCREVSCKGACESIGLSLVGCGAAEGYDQCLCD